MRSSFTAIVLCIMCALPGLVRAGEVYGAASSLSARRELEPVQSIEPCYRAWVMAGTNKFSFIIPSGFAFQGDPASGTLTLGNRDGNSQITLTVFDSPPLDGPGVNVETCRGLVLRQHPDAQIVRELNRTSCGETGPAFDLEWNVAGHVVQCKRVIYIPTGAGILEFSVTGSRANFPALQSSMDTLLMTFCYSTNGTLKVSRLSNES